MVTCGCWCVLDGEWGWAKKKIKGAKVIRYSNALSAVNSVHKQRVGPLKLLRSYTCSPVAPNKSLFNSDIFCIIPTIHTTHSLLELMLPSTSFIESPRHDTCYVTPLTSMLGPPALLHDLHPQSHPHHHFHQHEFL